MVQCQCVPGHFFLEAGVPCVIRPLELLDISWTNRSWYVSGIVHPGHPLLVKMFLHFSGKFFHWYLLELRVPCRGGDTNRMALTLFSVRSGWHWFWRSTGGDREDWMIYWGPSFLTFVWFGSTVHARPLPTSLPSANCFSFLSVMCVAGSA
jgi:hypothetical protein